MNIGARDQILGSPGTICDALTSSVTVCEVEFEGKIDINRYKKKSSEESPHNEMSSLISKEKNICKNWEKLILVVQATQSVVYYYGIVSSLRLLIYSVQNSQAFVAH